MRGVVGLALCVISTANAAEKPDRLFDHMRIFDGMQTQTIVTDFGPLYFKNIQLHRERRGVYFSATLESRATVDFQYVNLLGVMRNEGGGSTEMTFEARPLARGQSVTLSSPFYNRVPDRIGSFDVRVFTAGFKLAYTLRMLKPKEQILPTYTEDGKYEIDFSAIPEGLAVELKNLHDSEPITIDWNRSSFIEFSGAAGKISHNGVKFIEMNSVLPPTVIPPTSRHVDVLFPAKNAHYSSAIGWRISDTFPQTLPSEMGTARVSGAELAVYLDMSGAGTKPTLFRFRAGTDTPDTTGHAPPTVEVVNPATQSLSSILTVTCSQPNTEARVDDGDPKTLPIIGLLIAPGRHRVTIAKPGYVVWDEIVEVVTGELKSIAVDLHLGRLDSSKPKIIGLQ